MPSAPHAPEDSTHNGSDPGVFTTNAGRDSKRNASMACQGCKLSKRKCNGLLPCSNCLATHKICNYDPSQDGRRKQGRKRRLDELELRSQALDKLLSSLKSSSSSEAAQLLELIKGDASLEEIVRFLDRHPGKLADEARATLSPSPPLGSQQRRMLTLTELTDNPTYKVTAAPWTTVTEDDFFVSHLLSAYLSWYHWYYHNFDERLFLGAMAAGDLGSIYCSPFLVNAVLGMGCMFSDHPAVFATPGDLSSRGLQFYNEAYRLWMLEEGKPSLTNIQGFTLMTMM
ncbi:hypothetical protein G647_06576 [Cladophialophora carrionii CBS 160.54]|uniref:Zn(2)-C6 fungal-type domain-containing protein n=1 Tax=Cladophialophora carrionii CBS 160.54 TaxID=1279043 RepID=V9D789_9EURO|nr:uncharacterized protein G647_06576 [Cladophialophora carrionii CBS 160.54]ETI22501.1 hypothetical protein G647_06576 [Cladophialophora carrionii CBS 160.54]